MKCEDCKWWEDLGKGLGHCRRYPPQILRTRDESAIDLELYIEWPTPDENEWCGEFADAKSSLFILEDLCFSVRTRNALRKMEIKTKGEFLNLTAKDILSRRNLGEISLREIQRKQEIIQIE